jgi:hypothetical protein
LAPSNTPKSTTWAIRSLEILNQRAAQSGLCGHYSPGPCSPWKENTEPENVTFCLPWSPPRDRLSTPKKSPFVCRDRDLFRQLSPAGTHVMESLAIANGSASVEWSPGSRSGLLREPHCAGVSGHFHVLKGI